MAAIQLNQRRLTWRMTYKLLRASKGAGKRPKGGLEKQKASFHNRLIQTQEVQSTEVGDRWTKKLSKYSVI